MFAAPKSAAVAISIHVAAAGGMSDVMGGGGGTEPAWM